MHDTWGIAGPTFLRWYVAAALTAVVAPAVVTAFWRKAQSRNHAPARLLTAPEVGALTSDYQALIASLALLRSAEILAPGGARARGLTTDERSRIDWFTRTVLERLGSGKTPIAKSRLVGGLSVAFAQLRSPLIEMGYLFGDGERRAAKFRVWCVLAVAAVGVVRIFAGLAGGKPVLYLVLTVTVLVLTVPFVRRVRRTTALGAAELRRLSVENAHLAPRMRPSFRTYGPVQAAMSTALFGGASLLWLDPSMAGAMTANYAAGSDSGSWSGTSSSCSSSSDSGGGSSSGCGGGGGCGG